MEVAMPNSMTYLLEMSFIPNPEAAPKFFLWFTTLEGDPVKLPHRLFESLLKDNSWSEQFITSETEPMQTVMMEDDIIEVTGIAVNMFRVYQSLLHDNVSLSHSRFKLGESFSYWELIAKSLHILLRQGQYFPIFLSFPDEGRRTLIAHWMLSREAVQRERLFYQWLRVAPSSLFSLLQMGSMTINDWQNILLDTWIDQILRNQQDISHDILFQPFKGPMNQKKQEIVAQWIDQLRQSAELGIFYVSDDRETMACVREIEMDVERWHRPLSQSAYLDNKLVLSSHLKQMIEQSFKATKLKLYCEPASVEDPFHPYRPWRASLVLEGVKQEVLIQYKGEELTSLHPVTKSWLKSKCDQLTSFSDDLIPLVNDQKYMPYEGKLELKTVLFLQKQRHLLEKIGIDLVIPSDLDWRTINEDDFSMDLTVNQQNQAVIEEDAPIADASQFTRAGITLNSLINFDWKIAVGEIELTLKEFKALVESQQRMIYLRNEWVELPIERMAEAYDELRLIETDVVQKNTTMTDLLHVYVKDHDRKTRQIQLKIQDKMEDYLNKLVSKPQMINFGIPKELKGTLRPYQEYGFQWFCSLHDKGVGGCLADDMGLGKTIQSIAYLLYQEIEEQKGSKTPSLILCPTSVIENWKSEMTKFSPSLKTMVYHGPHRPMAEQFFEEIKGVDVLITSYHLFVRDSEWLLKQRWDTAILDEAQMIKNPGTKQSQTVRKIKAAQRFALTGTPMENKLDELWSIMDFLNPGYLGSLSHFRSYFITPIEKHGDEERLNLVRRLVQPFLLRRTKDDPEVIQDLPDKLEDKIICHLTKEQASLYQSVVDDLMGKMESSNGIERKGLILAAITRLKQVCNHPMLISGEWEKQKGTIFKERPTEVLKASGKLLEFLSLLDSMIGKNEKGLVFTQYVKTGQLLKQAIQERFTSTPVFFLYGGIPSEQRTALIEQFRNLHGQSAVFILSLKAGGVGLNLTEANHVIHFDRWWNPAVENQATDRAYRIGQTRHVHVTKFISKGTLEEGIDQLIEKKKWLTDQVIGQGDSWITEMTNEEVFELVRLREKVMS